MSTARRRWRRRRRALLLTLRENQWALPVLGALVGALLSLAMIATESDPDPQDWGVTVDRARDTLISILAILFAGLAIVLSMSAMTAQTVASRFSLRLLRIWLRGLADKVVIAVFVATTTFIIIEAARMASLSPDDLAPPASVVCAGVLLVLSGLTIVWHINHTLQGIRVDRSVRLVARMTTRTAAAWERHHRDLDGTDPEALTPPPAAGALRAVDAGYVRSIDVDTLAEEAAEKALDVAISVEAGDFVVTGDPLGWVSGPEGGRPTGDLAELVDAVDLGPSRDPSQDVAFGIRVLVDIALMAVSPAVNDPYTAVQCVNQLSVVLVDLAGRRNGPLAHRGTGPGPRVVLGAPTLDDYLHQATDELLEYGRDDPTVVGALGHLADAVRRVTRSDRDRAATEALVGRIDVVVAQR